MKFTSGGSVIQIVQVYNRFDVYVDRTMVLHNITQEDVNDIIKAYEASKKAEGQNNEQ